MKRDIIFGVGSFIVAFVSMMLLAVSQSSAQDGQLHETFDNITLPGWHNVPEVLVQDGALHMPGSTTATPPGTWEDLTLTLRMRLTGQGGLAITYRSGPTGTNILVIDHTTVDLAREAPNGDMLHLGGVASLTLPDNAWFEVTLTVVGGEHQVALNGEVVLTATEREPLPAGGVAFETLHQTTVDIDELTITTETSLADSPPPTPVSEVPPGAPATCETRDGFSLCPDLQYTAGDQAPPLALDLYLPSTHEAPPVLVFIHGGGWFEGSKEVCPGTTFAQHGYAVACVDYRLAVANCAADRVFPAQIHDIKGAVRWLRQNASVYGYDADHIGALGDSSGGHLAALLGVSDGAAELEGTANPGASSAVQAVVDWFGPVDITQGPMVFEDDPCLTNIGALSATYGGEEVPYFYWTYAWGVFLGGSLTDPATLDQAAQATPLTYVDAQDPPFLILHGETDGMVPIAQSELLANALQAAGVDVTFIRLPEAGHGYGTPDGAVMPDFLTPTLQFFDTHLKNN